MYTKQANSAHSTGSQELKPFGQFGPVMIRRDLLTEGGSPRAEEQDMKTSETSPQPNEVPFTRWLRNLWLKNVPGEILAGL